MYLRLADITMTEPEVIIYTGKTVSGFNIPQIEPHIIGSFKFSSLPFGKIHILNEVKSYTPTSTAKLLKVGKSLLSELYGFLSIQVSIRNTEIVYANDVEITKKDVDRWSTELKSILAILSV